MAEPSVNKQHKNTLPATELRMRTGRGVLFAIGFLLLVIHASGIILEKGNLKENENRERATWPVLPAKPREIPKFLRGINDFASDNFGARDLLAQTQRNISHAWQSSPVPLVRFGRDGFLFYANDQIVESMPHSISEEHLGQWVAVIRKRAKKLKHKGIPFVVTVAPNKHSIYGNKLPFSLYDESGPTAGPRLIAALLKADVPNLTVVAMAEPLKQSAKKQLVYHKLDTHWNDQGAFIGYQELLKAPPLRMGGLLKLSDFQVTQKHEHFGGLRRMIGVALPASPWVRFKRKGKSCAVYKPKHSAKSASARRGQFQTNCALQSGSLYVIRDSFTDALIPFLSESFGQVVYQKMGSSIHWKQIDRFKPDVVVWELVERKIGKAPPRK